MLAGSVSANDLSSDAVGLHNDGNIQIDDATSYNAKLKMSPANANSYENVLGASGDGNFSSLAELLRNGGNVVLDKDYVYDNTTDSHYIQGIEIISDNMVIDGQNHVIDANNISGIFHILAKNVTLKNIIFVNSGSYSLNSTGDIVFNGGALHFNASASDAKVLNCTFKDCIAWNGSAIYADSTDGLIDQCKFYNCTSALAGGAVYLNGKRNRISNSTFTNCSSTISGGAVYWNGINGVMDNSTFNDCYVKNQDVDLEGGAIYWNAANGTVNKCNFTDCFVNKTTSNNNIYGGAIYWNGEDGTVDNSTFVHCYFDTEGVNYLRGLCIYWTGKNGVVNNTLFENCTAATTTNNRPYLGSAVYWNATEGIIDNSTFRHMNSMYGGAILINKESANGTVKNSTFYNCTSFFGGAIYSSGEKTNITGSTFINCISNQDGGAVYSSGDNVIISDNEFMLFPVLEIMLLL